MSCSKAREASRESFDEVFLEAFLEAFREARLEALQETSHDLIREAMRTFVRVQAGKRLAALGGKAPDMKLVARRRPLARSPSVWGSET